MAKNRLHLALVQDNPTVGDIETNLQKILEHMDRNPDSDIIVFPECFLTGYPLNDLVLRPGFLARVRAAIDALSTEIQDRNGPSVLVGAPLPATGLPFNCAILIDARGGVQISRKVELPNSDVFDERRTFNSASEAEVAPMTFDGFRLGVAICEDMWHGRVSRRLADEMADVLLMINGSPYSREKDSERRQHARTRVFTTGLPLIYLNQVGGQDELVFDGGSFVLNTDGATMSAHAFRPDTLHVVLHRGDDGLVRVEARNPSEISKYPSDVIEADYRACVTGLSDYVAKTGTGHVFVGVSGGLDSALVLTMAVDALGAGNVTGVRMPSIHTSEESLALAEDIATRLGVRCLTIPIEDPVIKMQEALDAAVTDATSENLGLMRENLQSRLRGTILMGLTNALGGILLSTGNKSEMAVGYATLYGDMNGGFNPLKSVYKSEAFLMASWRNAADPSRLSNMAVADPIPERIISRPPTAELAEDQDDESALGEYAVLDAVLKSLIEDLNTIPETARAIERRFGDCLDGKIGDLSAQAYTARIAGLVRRAQYKRIQSPPGVKLHSTDFGLGWRYPVAGSYTL